MAPRKLIKEYINRTESFGKLLEFQIEPLSTAHESRDVGQVTPVVSASLSVDGRHRAGEDVPRSPFTQFSEFYDQFYFGIRIL